MYLSPFPKSTSQIYFWSLTKGKTVQDSKKFWVSSLGIDKEEINFRLNEDNLIFNNMENNVDPHLF